MFIAKFLSHLSLTQKIVLVCLTSALIPVWLINWLSEVSWQLWLISTSMTIVIASMLSLWLSRSLVNGIQSLETGLLNFIDGELSSSLAYQQADELGHLCQLYNQAATKLRQEKQGIYHRELMLDKVLQSTPHAVLLVNEHDTVVYSNHSARDLINVKNAIEGANLKQILSQALPQLQSAITTGLEGLFTLENKQQGSQTWHLSSGKLLLNNQVHRLYIFKQLTRELSRQEVEVWKKVIRIISHELNNSLGPMSSMLHSGQLLTKNLDEPRLKKVFTTIDERIKHLNDFVQGYGKFAKLPTPKKEVINWKSLLTQLQQQWQFTLEIAENVNTMADNTQLEQLLINLIKNAHESGSLKENVSLVIQQNINGTQLSVIDKGKGMTETVMASALIPFYSTKTSGSGLGLALCREIVEAHNGQISLHNPVSGGLHVNVILPNSESIS